MTAPSKHLTIRSIPPRVARALDAERRRRGTSLNQTVVDLLARALGTERETNGIEELAGTWSEADLESFSQATSVTEAIDDELWK